MPVGYCAILGQSTELFLGNELMSTTSPPLYVPSDVVGRTRSNYVGSLNASQSDNVGSGGGQRETGLTARLLMILSIVLTGVTGVVLLLVWMVGTELSRAGHTIDTSMRQIEIGNDVLAVQANHIRFRSQRRNGIVDRADLYFFWPQMSGFTEALENEFNSDTVNPNILFVTLEPRRMSRDMSGRIDAIYRKFFVGAPTSAPGGLLRQNLSTASGYAGEYLVFERSNPQPFVARCVEDSEAGATPYCIRDFHIGRDISVTYRFHISLLDQWMPLDYAIRASINAMIVQ